ncbi:hypothetical protein JCM12107_23260 [Corynebacterium simulans]
MLSDAVGLKTRGVVAVFLVPALLAESRRIMWVNCKKGSLKEGLRLRHAEE